MNKGMHNPLQYVPPSIMRNDIVKTKIKIDVS